MAMVLVNRCAVTVIPRQPMLDWLLPFAGDADDPRLQQDSSVYLLPAYHDDQQAWQRLQEVSDRIFSAELVLWCRDQQQWPQQRDFSVFLHWFSVTFHSLVADLSPEPLALLALDPDLTADLRRSLGAAAAISPA